MAAVGYIIPMQHQRRVAEAEKAEQAKRENKEDEERNSVKASLKTASVTPPDCKLGKT